MHAYIWNKRQYFLELLDFSTEKDFLIRNKNGQTLFDMITTDELNTFFSDYYLSSMTLKVKSILTDFQQRKLFIEENNKNDERK